VCLLLWKSGECEETAYKGKELAIHVSGLLDFVLMWYRPRERGLIVPWKLRGGERVILSWLRAAGSVIRRAWAKGRERSHCSAELASASVALLAGLAW